LSPGFLSSSSPLLRSSSPSGGSGSEECGDASEVEVLQRRINDLIEEKKHSDEVLSALTEQNWEYLINRSERIKAKFDREMESLISDVHALCEFSQQQKQRAYITPARSRASSRGSDHGSSAAIAAAASSPSPASALHHHHRHHLHGNHGQPHVSSSSAAKAKEFVWRDSQLTSMFRTSSDIKTVYNVRLRSLLLLLTTAAFI